MMIILGTYRMLRTVVGTFSLLAFCFRAISKVNFKNARETAAAIPLARIQISPYNKLVII